MQVLSLQFIGNTLLNWIVAAVIFILAFSFVVILKNKALMRMKQTPAQHVPRVNDIVFDLISQTHLYAIFGLALYLASLVLNLSANAAVFLRTGTLILLLLQIAVWGNRSITLTVTHEVRRRVSINDQSSTTINLLGFFAKVILWTIILLGVLDNLPNFHVDSLIASLGITGIAVAISVQRILSDLFASLSIALDKPFVIGDFIIVDQIQGTVEDVGLKSTRIRSLFGEQIVMSNSDLLNSRVRNFKRMVDRRVAFQLKIAADVPMEKLLRIPPLVQEIIQTQSSVRFDRAHFESIGDYFYNFEIVYYVLSPSYTLYMDLQQNINLAILNRFQEESIHLAMR